MFVCTVSVVKKRNVSRALLTHSSHSAYKSSRREQYNFYFYYFGLIFKRSVLVLGILADYRMFTSSPRRAFLSDIAPATALEQSLGAAYDLADEKIAQLSLLQESVRPAREIENSTMSIARPSSVPRGRITPQCDELKLNANHPSTSDRKLESVVRRLKLLEERYKKADKDIIETSRAVNDHASLIDQLLDGQATEKKTLHVIREHVGSLKSQVEVLTHKDEILERTLQRPSLQPQSIDVDAIQEVVFQRVKDEFSKVVREVVKSCASEQANFLSKWAEWNPANVDCSTKELDMTSAQLGPALNSIDKEFAKLKAENARMKMRLDALESGHHSLRNSTKLSITEEAQKRLFSSHKAEVQSMLDSVGKRINEVMLSSATPGKEVAENVRNIEASIADTNDKFSSTVHNIETEMNELRKQILRASNGFNESKEESAAKASIELMKFEMEKKLSSLLAEVEAHKIDSKKAISTLSDSNKKIRAKINDLTSSVSSMSQARKAVELLLQEVDAKAHEDASWSYQFKTTSQKLEQRISVLETKVSLGNQEAETDSRATESKLNLMEGRLERAESDIRQCSEQARMQALANASTNRVSSVDQQFTTLLGTLSSHVSGIDSRLAAVEVSRGAASQLSLGRCFVILFDFF